MALRPCASHWNHKKLVRRAMLVIGSVNLSPCSVLLWYVDTNESYIMTNSSFWEVPPLPLGPGIKWYTFIVFLRMSPNDSEWQWITGQETWQKSINEHNAFEKMALGDKRRQRKAVSDPRDRSTHRRMTAFPSPSSSLGYSRRHIRTRPRPPAESRESLKFRWLYLCPLSCQKKPLPLFSSW